MDSWWYHRVAGLALLSLVTLSGSQPVAMPEHHQKSLAKVVDTANKFQVRLNEAHRLIEKAKTQRSKMMEGTEVHTYCLYIRSLCNLLVC